MNTNKEHLAEIIGQLPPAAQLEAMNFLDYLAWKYRPEEINASQGEISNSAPSHTAYPDENFENPEKLEKEENKKENRWDNFSAKWFS